MSERYPPSLVAVSWSAPLVVITDGRSPTGRPVVLVPGWPMDLPIPAYLDAQVRGIDGLVRSLTATGRTVILCAAGSCWGTTTDWPDTGALGRGVIDAAITYAAGIGCDTSTIDVIGVSHGGVVALNWSWRNPSKLHRLWLQAPAWDLSDIYDRDSVTTGLGFPALSTSMRGVTGTVDKTACMAALTDYDPHRNLSSIAVIADRTVVVSAANDELVDIATLTADLASLGVPLTTLTAGGHFFASAAAEWSDLAPLRHFDS